MAALIQPQQLIQLKQKIIDLRLPESFANSIDSMTHAQLTDLWDQISRFDHEKNHIDLIWRMADTHAGFFSELNFSSYEDFAQQIITVYKDKFGPNNTQANTQKNLETLATTGYEILQTHLIKTLEELQRVKMLVAQSLDGDDSKIERYYQARIDYFKSRKFIENLGDVIPERTDLDTQTSSGTGYQEFLSTLFQTSSKIKFRKGIEGMTAAKQCQAVMRPNQTARQFLSNSGPRPTCYICGFPLEQPDEERGFNIIECEHLLPVIIAIMDYWIVKSTHISPEDRDFLIREYRWSHQCCNRIKDNLSLLEKNFFGAVMGSYYFSKRRARQLLDNIYNQATETAIAAHKKNGNWTNGLGVKPFSDCLQVYQGLHNAKLLNEPGRRDWTNDRIRSLSYDFSPITEILNNTRIATNAIASVEANKFLRGQQKLFPGTETDGMALIEKGLKEIFVRYKIIAAMSRDFLRQVLTDGGGGIVKTSGKVIIDKIGNKKLIKKELQKSNSKLKKLLDIGNRLKLGLDYRNKKYDTKNDDSLFNFKLNYMRKSLGDEIFDSIKNITNKKSLNSWIDEMFLKIKNLPKDRKEYETSVKKNHKQLSQVDDKVELFNIKDKKNKAKGIKKKKYITVNIKLYPKLKTIPKLAFIPISLVSSKILTSLNKLNIENYKLIELKTSVSNDLSYFLIEFNLDIDKKYDKNLINSQIKNLFNNESFLLDINENSISSFPIFDKVNVSISNLNNKTKNKHSRGKGMRSKGVRIRKAKGIRKTKKTKKTKKNKKQRKN